MLAAAVITALPPNVPALAANEQAIWPPLQSEWRPSKMILPAEALGRNHLLDTDKRSRLRDQLS